MHKERVRNGALILSLTKQDSVTERIKPTLPPPIHSLSSSLSKSPRTARRKASSGHQLQGYRYRGPIKVHIKLTSVISVSISKAPCRSTVTKSCTGNWTLGPGSFSTAPLIYIKKKYYIQPTVPLYCSHSKSLDRTSTAWHDYKKIVCGIWVLLRGFGAAD